MSIKSFPAKHSKIFKESGGFSMIEVMLSFVILSVAIILMYGVLSSSGKLNYTLPDRITANYLAEEGFEIIRNKRDGNLIAGLLWSNGLTNCSSGCQADYKTGTLAEGAENALQAYNNNNYLKQGSGGLLSYSSGNTSKFKRKITVTSIYHPLNPLNLIAFKINSLVMWDYSGKPYNSEVIGYIYNWQ